MNAAADSKYINYQEQGNSGNTASLQEIADGTTWERIMEQAVWHASVGDYAARTVNFTPTCF
jgi:hypothetical protein